MREGHLHDDRKSYGSEPEAMFPFPGEAARHKNGPLLHRKFMWQDRHSATQRSPTVQAVYSKQAENLLVGKTKSGLDHGVGHPLLLLYDVKAPHGQNGNEFKALYHYPSASL